MVSLLCLVPAAGARATIESESFGVVAQVVTAGGAPRVSPSFGIVHDAVGQPVVGAAAGTLYGAAHGFVHGQLHDETLPLVIEVADGLDLDVDLSSDTAGLCANWVSSDPESGVFAHRVAVGTSPGADDVLAWTTLGPATAVCFEGPFAGCRTYHVTVRAQNGAGGLGDPVASDGVLLLGFAGESDTDGDGVIDTCDVDDDGDGIADHAEQDGALDTDSDGRPDSRDIDADGDGVLDLVEAQTAFPPLLPAGVDADGDGLDDAFDALEGGVRIVPPDADGDEQPDPFDPDADGDGVPDAIEAHDADGNGLADVAPIGLDGDGDGLDDAFDTVLAPDPLLNPSGGVAALPDHDADGARDWRDADDDGDGLPTAVEDRNGNGTFHDDDGDGDGTPDYLDPDPPIDTDGDGLPNDVDPDDDDDGIPDGQDDCPCDPQNDADGDLLCDDHPDCALGSDNCDADFNPSQADEDGDGIGDACDAACRVTVDGAPASGADCAAIQECVDAARAGCVIAVAPGVYAGAVTIDKPVALVGLEGPEATAIDPPGSGTAVTVGGFADGTASVDGFALLTSGTALDVTSDALLESILVESASLGLRVASGTSNASPSVRVSHAAFLGCDKAVDHLAGELELDPVWIAGTDGEALDLRAGSARVRNSLIVASGVGLRLRNGASATVEFSTITGCTTGATRTGAASVAIRNSILAENGDNLAGQLACGDLQYTAIGTAIADLLCCINPTVLCQAPAFVNPGAGDFRLAPGSPLIDAAEVPFAGEPCGDFLDDLRVRDGDGDGIPVADLGAHEHVPAAGSGVVIRFDAPGVLSWNPSPGFADYELYRTELSVLGYDAPWSCIDTTPAAPFLLDPGVPDPGDAFLYLVAGRTAGGTLGPSGFGTCAERPRPAPCP